MFSILFTVYFAHFQNGVQAGRCTAMVGREAAVRESYYYHFLFTFFFLPRFLPNGMAALLTLLSSIDKSRYLDVVVNGAGRAISLDGSGGGVGGTRDGLGAGTTRGRKKWGREMRREASRRG